MLKITNRITTKALATLLIGFLLLLTTQAALASDNPAESDRDKPAEAAPADEAKTERVSQPDSQPTGVKIAYTLYSDTAAPAPGATQPDPENAATATGKTAAPGAVPPSNKPRASTAPMTAGEKFNMFLKRSFVPPGAFAQPIASGLFNELLDNNEGKEDTLDDYFADAMTRAARSYAFRVTSNFFEKFAYPVIFKQDPRYHRSDKSSVGGKIGYAVSRLFITQGDRSGDQPNVSYLLGGLTAAAISNVWVREEHQNVSHTFRRWGIHLGLTAASNILREFLSGQ